MTGLTNYDSIEDADLSIVLTALNTRNIAPHTIISIYYTGSVHVAVFKL